MTHTDAAPDPGARNWQTTPDGRRRRRQRGPKTLLPDDWTPGEDFTREALRLGLSPATETQRFTTIMRKSRALSPDWDFDAIQWLRRTAAKQEHANRDRQRRNRQTLDGARDSQGQWVALAGTIPGGIDMAAAVRAHLDDATPAGSCPVCKAAKPNRATHGRDRKETQ